jgi:hypothetical protein
MRTQDDARTTLALRALDAADHQPSQAQRTHAAATLERILAADPDTPTPVAAPAGRPRRTRGLLLAGGAVAAATVAVLVVPILSDGSEAFASWSPTPVELTGAERDAAVDACLVLQGNEGGELDFDPTADASVLLAEARGGWSYVVFRVAGSSGTELQGSCLVPDDLVADPRPGEGGFFGGLGPADDTAGPRPARDAVREDISGSGSVDDEAFVYAEGRVGGDVAGIEVTTPGGLEVEASIANGHWAVWWPAGDDSMDNPELTGAPTYTVTLRDGTITEEVSTS